MARGSKLADAHSRPSPSLKQPAPISCCQHATPPVGLNSEPSSRITVCRSYEFRTRCDISGDDAGRLNQASTTPEPDQYWDSAARDFSVPGATTTLNFLLLTYETGRQGPPALLAPVLYCSARFYGSCGNLLARERQLNPMALQRFPRCQQRTSIARGRLPV